MIQVLSSKKVFYEKKIEYLDQRADTPSLKGLMIAVTILSLWLISLFSLFSVHVFHLNLWLVGFALIWQSFLYTGLFITAHDAMHGAVFPTNLRINHTIGSIAVLCYGLFSYRDLLRKHWLHHKYPGTDRDPDFHNEDRTDFLSWYFQFMQHYWSWSRIAALALLFSGVYYFLKVSEVNLILFWVIPPIVSSVQLFYFGTFLTHREPDAGYSNSHRAQNTTFTPLWSFLACYHFGYHEEHHEYPHIPWWQLPKIYRLRRSLIHDSELN